MRYAGRTSTTRSRALPEPSAHSPALTALAYSLYTSLGLERTRVRHLALRADRLGPDETAHHQLLLDEGDDKARRIEAVTDAARSRFGPRVITAATLTRPQRGGHPREQS
ncbi:hypothetical protein OG456_44410 [Streptomyces sp. NBC_01446]|nr:hypothetical protein [Streptomyces sp. NBC_01446]MCX5321525.1 hypothetical protein [Streptomyces sp. NBC_00120]